MKRLHLALALFAALACSGLYAQTALLQAEIPFDFQIRDVQMPAGAYTINSSAGLVALRNADGRHAVMALAISSTRDKYPETGILQFHRYGDTYFLAEVWTPFSHTGMAFPKTSREKELASRIGPSQMKEVALATK